MTEILDPSRILEGAETWFGKQVLFVICRIDPYGFERPEDFDYVAYEEFFSTYLVILTKRAIKWSKLLKGSGGVRKSLTGERPDAGWPSSHSTKCDLPQQPDPLWRDPRARPLDCGTSCRATLQQLEPPWQDSPAVDPSIEQPASVTPPTAPNLQQQDLTIMGLLSSRVPTSWNS